MTFTIYSPEFSVHERSHKYTRNKVYFWKNNQTVLSFKAFHVYALILRRFKIFFNSIYLVYLLKKIQHSSLFLRILLLFLTTPYFKNRNKTKMNNIKKSTGLQEAEFSDFYTGALLLILVPFLSSSGFTSSNRAVSQKLFSLNNEKLSLPQFIYA